MSRCNAIQVRNNRFQDLKRPNIGPCQENDTRSGSHDPSHGPLRFITSHSFRARLCHAKDEAPEEEADPGPILRLLLWPGAQEQMIAENKSI